MKTNNRFTIFAMLTLAVTLLFGCASTERAAYKSIGTVAISVDAGMKAWAQYVVDGKSTAEQEVKVKAGYVKYQAAMRVAEAAIRAYKADPNTRTFMETAVDVASASASELIELVHLFMPPPTKGTP